MTALHVDAVIARRANKQVGNGEGFSFREEIRDRAGCVLVPVEQ